jgi:2-dehydropantoate 2-reductase
MASQRITFVGAGALAQGLAVHVGSVAPVTLFATSRSYDEILGRGRIQLSGLSDRSLAVHEGAAVDTSSIGVVKDAAQIDSADSLIFGTKGPQLQGVIDSLGAHGGDGWVAGLQNGVQKDELLTKAFGAARVLGMATLFNARRGTDNDIIIGGTGKTYLGEFEGGASERVKSAGKLFAEAGLNVDLPDDIRSLLWTKCVNAIGIFGTTALARISTTDLFRSPELVAAYLSLMAEGKAIANAYGVQIRDFEDLPIGGYVDSPAAEVIDRIVTAARAKATGATSISSMAQDVMAERGTEVNEVFGYLVDQADAKGVPAPRIRFFRDIVSGLDNLRK